MVMLGELHQCPNCGQYVGAHQVHYCSPRINPWIRPPQPSYPQYPYPRQEIEEARLRRIVREEIERALKGNQTTVYLNGVKQ